VSEIDSAIRQSPDGGIVSNHQDRVPFNMKFPQQINDDLLIRFIEISSRLVSKQELRVIDERSRDGHALLLTA
jgi:hypothetical protein